MTAFARYAFSRIWAAIWMTLKILGYIPYKLLFYWWFTIIRIDYWDWSQEHNPPDAMRNKIGVEGKPRPKFHVEKGLDEYIYGWGAGLTIAALIIWGIISFAHWWVHR